MKAVMIGARDGALARVARSLAGHGWQVAWVEQPDAAAIHATTPDVMVLDGGFLGGRFLGQGAVLPGLRAGGRDMLILVLGEFALEQRAQALRLGADDFLAGDTPGEMLIARLFALLRLRSEAFQPVHRIGPLVIDAVHRRVSRDGRDIALSRREFQLLMLLARHAGSTVSRADILEHLAGGEADRGEAGLDALMMRLRRKIDGPHALRLLATIRGVGYRLAR